MLCEACWGQAAQVPAPPCPTCGGYGHVYCCDDAGARGQGAIYPPRAPHTLRAPVAPIPTIWRAGPPTPRYTNRDLRARTLRAS